MYKLADNALTYFHYPSNTIFHNLEDIEALILCYAKTRAYYCNQLDSQVLIEIIKHFWNAKNKLENRFNIADFIASSITTLSTSTSDTDKLNALKGITYPLFCVHNPPKC